MTGSVLHGPSVMSISDSRPNPEIASRDHPRKFHEMFLLRAAEQAERTQPKVWVLSTGLGGSSLTDRTCSMLYIVPTSASSDESACRNFAAWGTSSSTSSWRGHPLYPSSHLFTRQRQSPRCDKHTYHSGTLHLMTTIIPAYHRKNPGTFPRS